MDELDLVDESIDAHNTSIVEIDFSVHFAEDADEESMRALVEAFIGTEGESDAAPQDGDLTRLLSSPDVGATLLEALRADAPADAQNDITVEASDLELQTEVLHTTEYVEEAAPVNRGSESDGSQAEGVLGASTAVVVAAVCGAAVMMAAVGYAAAVWRDAKAASRRVRDIDRPVYGPEGN